MRCPICNRDSVENSMFCGGCGNRLPSVPVAPVAPVAPVQPVAPVPPTPPVQQYYQQPIPPNSGGLSGGQKGIIIGLLSMVVILLFVAVLTKGGGSVYKPVDPDNPDNPGVVVKEKEPTRTIMIYLEGSSLESQNGIASAELAAIDPLQVDLNTTNVIVYTGGTAKWFNYIKNNENAIYKLTSTGFEKIETYPKADMADPNTLSSFLNYAYNNYKAGHMDLLLFDHGAGTLGAIRDDFTGNWITMGNFVKAFEASPFKGDNKLELVLFRTCLNGTLETAVTFSNYAEYMVASEEVTWGSPASNVFGNFINGLPSDADALTTGKQFIEAYKKNMDTISILGNYLITYSVVDLSKAKALADEYQKFIDKIVLNEDNYYKLKRIRENILQFAISADSTATDYDTVDLYSFVKYISMDLGIDSGAFNTAFNDAVKYFYTNGSDLYGLSIYFPYRGPTMSRALLLSEYQYIPNMDNYYKFITKINKILNGEKIDDSSPFFGHPNILTVNEFDASTNSKKEVTLELTKEQKETYLTSHFALFKKDKAHPNFYQIIYISNDVEYKDGKITTKIGKNLVKVYDDGDEEYLTIRRNKSGGTINDTFNTILYNSKSSKYGSMDNASIKMINADGKPKFGDVTITSQRDMRFEGIVKDINEYTAIDVLKQRYKILDKNGKTMLEENWEKYPTIEGLELTNFKTKDINSEIDLRYESMDKNEEYYVLFFVFLSNNQEYQSNLIKVGD